jgi:hypothetical protein
MYKINDYILDSSAASSELCTVFVGSMFKKLSATLVQIKSHFEDVALTVKPDYHSRCRL